MKVPYKIGAESKQAFLQNVEKGLHHFDFPPQIIVETTSACNLRCIHCSHASMKRPIGHMKEALWRKIIDEIAETAPATEVWPTFYGEALILKRRISDWIRYAADRGLTNLVLNTNGTLLSDEMIHAMIDSGLHRFIVSLDGFRPETFEKIRLGARHDVVYPQVERLLQLKRDRGARHMTVEVQFSMMEENEAEVEDFRRYWLARGAIVKTREKLTWTGTKEAANLDSALERIACPWAVRTCAIHWNGNVVACAVDYEGGWVSGNVGQETIESIWNSSHKQFVENHLQHHFDVLPELCRQCLDWQVGGGAAHEEPAMLGPGEGI